MHKLSFCWSLLPEKTYFIFEVNNRIGYFSVKTSTFRGFVSSEIVKRFLLEHFLALDCNKLLKKVFLFDHCYQLYIRLHFFCVSAHLIHELSVSLSKLLLLFRTTFWLDYFLLEWFQSARQTKCMGTNV